MLLIEGVIMQVGFNPSINFKNTQHTESIEENAEKVVAPKTKPVEKDTVEVSEPSIRRQYREKVGTVTKFAVKTSEMTQASVKAVGYGALTGIGFMFANWIFKAIPKSINGKGEMGFWKTLAHPFSSVSKRGKWVSGVAALCVAGWHITKGLLKSNQKTANVDHQLKIGHRAK